MKTSRGLVCKLRGVVGPSCKYVILSQEMNVQGGDRCGQVHGLTPFPVFSGGPAGSSVGGMGTVMTLPLARKDVGSRTASAQHLLGNRTLEADIPQPGIVSKHGSRLPQKQLTFKPHSASAPPGWIGKPTQPPGFL